MNPLLVAVLAALGLQETTKPEDATAAIAALKAGAGEATALKAKVAELEPKAAKASELETAIVALQAGSPDPAKYVPIATMTELQTQVATLAAANNGRQVDELVIAALKEGKLLPAMEKWARELGAKDCAALKAYIESAAPITALAGTQTQGRDRAAAGNGLTESQVAICSQLGLDQEAYKKQLAAAA